MTIHTVMGETTGLSCGVRRERGGSGSTEAAASAARIATPRRLFARVSYTSPSTSAAVMLAREVSGSVPVERHSLARYGAGKRAVGNLVTRC